MRQEDKGNGKEKMRGLDIVRAEVEKTKFKIWYGAELSCVKARWKEWVAG